MGCDAWDVASGACFTLSHLKNRAPRPSPVLADGGQALSPVGGGAGLKQGIGLVVDFIVRVLKPRIKTRVFCVKGSSEFGKTKEERSLSSRHTCQTVHPVR